MGIRQKYDCENKHIFGCGKPLDFMRSFLGLRSTFWSADLSPSPTVNIIFSADYHVMSNKKSIVNLTPELTWSVNFVQFCPTIAPGLKFSTFSIGIDIYQYSNFPSNHLFVCPAIIFLFSIPKPIQKFLLLTKKKKLKIV